MPAAVLVCTAVCMCMPVRIVHCSVVVSWASSFGRVQGAPQKAMLEGCAVVVVALPVCACLVVLRCNLLDLMMEDEAWTPSQSCIC